MKIWGVILKRKDGLNKWDLSMIIGVRHDGIIWSRIKRKAKTKKVCNISMYMAIVQISNSLCLHH